MRKKFFTFILSSIVLINISFSQSGWFWVNPLPQGNDLLDVKIFESGNSYACGKFGLVLKSTDFGFNWSIIRSELNYSSRSMYFQNESTGWISISSGDPIIPGNARLLKTTNGGLNWIDKMTIGGMYGVSIEFTGNDTGYFCVRAYNSGSVYKTVNKGDTWEIVYSVSNKTINNSFFYNNSTGYICGSIGISKTTNGGMNWINQWSNPVNLMSINFIDLNTGFASGVSYSGGMVLKTTNGGINWYPNGVFGNYEINSIYFINNNTGFFCGYGILC